jgi:tetratricopeptide (TPR) repeat protein
MEQGSVPPQGRRSAGDAPPPETPRPADTSTDDLDERIRLVPAAERPVVLVDHFAPRTSSDGLGWIAELAVSAERYDLSLPGIRRAATDLAWLARLAEQRYPGELEWGSVRGLGGSATQRLVLAYVHGQRLRFDYRFRELQTRCNEWLGEFHDDALILGFAAFGGLGTRALNGLNLFTRAVEAPDADDKSRQVCLSAVWFADHLEDQPEILLRLSDEMMARGESNANIHYRRAAALRRLGRYDDALAEVDLAIDLFGVGNIMVHEQYAQERRTIIHTRDMNRRAEETAARLGAEISARVDERIDQASAALEEKIDEASRHLAQRVSVAQELVSEGLLKMVEVLGLFVTLLGFLVGSGTVIVKARSFSERAIAMSVVLVGALAFFALLRLVTNLRRRPL